MLFVSYSKILWQSLDIRQKYQTSLSSMILCLSLTNLGLFSGFFIHDLTWGHTSHLNSCHDNGVSPLIENSFLASPHSTLPFLTLTFFEEFTLQASLSLGLIVA